MHHPLSVERAFHDRLPITSVARTLIDFAVAAGFDDLRAAVAEADFRGLLDVDELERLAGRGIPGSAAIRRALGRAQPRLAYTRTDLERRFVVLCEDHGLPMPQVNVLVAGFDVDAVWHAERLVVEVDGGPAHTGRDRMENDRQRELVLRSHGYRVVRYSWRQVSSEPAVVAADLARVLAGGGLTILTSRRGGRVAEGTRLLSE